MMKRWIIDIFKITKFFDNVLKSIQITNHELGKLVDRVNQLEQTVQSLSDENQTLIQKLYSKKGE